MVKLVVLNKFVEEQNILDNLYLFAQRGNINVLKNYMKKAQDNYSCGFNWLHVGAITGELEGSINWFSVVKKAQNNNNISPLHFACINPDVQVLWKLYSVNPDYSSSDFTQRKLVHYAAANHFEQVMEFLIAKGIPCNDKDAWGNTPLMIAASLGWIQTVLVLLKESKKQLENLDEDDEDYHIMMKTADFINSIGPLKKTALHFAVESSSF